MGQMLSKLNIENRFGFLTSRRVYLPQYEGGLTTVFLGSPVLKKIISSARTEKSFVGQKCHCFITHISWHGISSENMEKLTSVQNETPNAKHLTPLYA